MRQMPGLQWNHGIGAEVKLAIWKWETDTGECLGLRCSTAPMLQNEMWDGDTIHFFFGGR